MNNKINYANIFLGVFFILITMFFVYAIGGSVIKQYNASKNYIQTEAQILHSSIVKSRSNKGKTSYTFKVRFSYKVNDIYYQSNKYTFFGGYNSSDYSQTELIRNAYPEGSTQNAYYDPKNPNNCILNNYKPSLLLIFGVFIFLSLFLIIPLFLIFKEIKKLKN